MHMVSREKFKHLAQSVFGNLRFNFQVILTAYVVSICNIRDGEPPEKSTGWASSVRKHGLLLTYDRP